MKYKHQRRRHDEIDHRGREQELPPERHQLVVAVARQRPAHPDVGEENRADLQQEGDPAQTVGVEQRNAVPAAEIQIGRDRRHRRHVDVLGLRKECEADGAVLGVVPGDQLLFGLGKIKRRAVGLGDTGDDIDDEADRLQEHVPAAG